MTLYPDTAPALLGFDAIRARLAHHARGPEAAERLAALEPFATAPEARAELERVAETTDALRFDDPVPLGNVLDVRDTLRRIAPEGGTAAPEDLLALRLVLETVRRMRGYLDARRAKYPALARLAEGLHPVPDLERRLAAVVGDDGAVRDDASPELHRLRRALVRAGQALRESIGEEMRRAVAAGFAADEQPTVRGGRVVLPIRAEAKRKIAGFIHDTSATGQTVYLEPASVLDAGNDLREMEAAERREVERVLREASAAAREALPALRESRAALTAFDALVAKGRLAAEIGAERYELGDEGVIELRNARHAALALRFQAEAHTAGAREVVPLSLRLDDEARTLVITGPNAGGKSVALKTVGLLALMAGCGLLLPVGPGSRVDFFGRLFADIGDAQSLEDDLSTFTSHVARLRHILEDAGPDGALAGTLVLLDEAGTGTDPGEGGALAQAVLERLTEAGARTVVTTHIGALKAFAHGYPHAVNGAMVFDRETLAPTYRFAAGVPGSSYAFEIAGRGGLDPDVIERARGLVGTQASALEDLILSFQSRTQALERALADAEAARKEAESARADFEERRGTIRRQRDALRAEALSEAERIVKEANARVERTIREIREAQANPEATKAARTELAAFAGNVTARKQKQARPRAAPAPLPAFAVGDQVVLDGGTSVAEIVGIEGQEAVLASGPFRLRAALTRLQKVGGKPKQTVQVRQVSAAPGGLPALGARTTLDVRGQRVDEALAELPRFVDAAVAAGAERVEILHGKGTGALRQGMREWLARQPEVTGFEDAPNEGGGAGVTVVMLR